MAEQPKKPRRNSKSKKITLNKSKSWKEIVNQVEKRNVPVSILQDIVVRLIDGTSITIDIRRLIDADGMSSDEIEDLLDAKFIELDQYIENVDFIVDISKVADTIQPETDKALRGL